MIQCLEVNHNGTDCRALKGVIHEYFILPFDLNVVHAK